MSSRWVSEWAASPISHFYLPSLKWSSLAALAAETTKYTTTTTYCTTNSSTNRKNTTSDLTSYSVSNTSKANKGVSWLFYCCYVTFVTNFVSIIVIIECSFVKLLVFGRHFAFTEWQNKDYKRWTWTNWLFIRAGLNSGLYNLSKSRSQHDTRIYVPYSWREVRGFPWVPLLTSRGNAGDGLSSFSEETRTNHLQVLQLGQQILHNFFKTLTSFFAETRHSDHLTAQVSKTIKNDFIFLNVPSGDCQIIVL